MAAGLLKELLPEFQRELHSLLVAVHESELAAQTASLRIVGRCGCNDDFCASFRTLPKPKNSYGPDHRNVVLQPAGGMIVLDVVEGNIAFVEVLFRDEIRDRLRQLMP